MTAKEHYDNHLGNFYSWMTGDFDQHENRFRSFCIGNGIIPQKTRVAIDLGAGNGIQTIALADLGFTVTAIDFNNQLLTELQSRAKGHPVSVINDDIRNLKKYSQVQPELIVCCGDTITHLESPDEVRQLIAGASEILVPKGKIVLSFRDYSQELQDTQRFIPVKSDTQRILTCLLEYFPDKIRVTDLLHELVSGKWEQKISSYFKIRLSKETITGLLKKSGFSILYEQTEQGLIKMIAENTDLKSRF